MKSVSFQIDFSNGQGWFGDIDRFIIENFKASGIIRNCWFIIKIEYSTDELLKNSIFQVFNGVMSYCNISYYINCKYKLDVYGIVKIFGSDSEIHDIGLNSTIKGQRSVTFYAIYW